MDPGGGEGTIRSTIAKERPMTETPSNAPSTGPSVPNRPERLVETPIPPIPETDESQPDASSVRLSNYRTHLSHHRTHLSEHRTDLSEYRTDLSGSRTQMSMRRTGMSFQRTRMSGDRTLMSVIRTSLSLIGFGFTIYEAFKKLNEAGAIRHATAPRNFGLILILIGVALLIGGLVQEVRFNAGLVRLRRQMAQDKLIYGESLFPISIAAVAAIALLLVGLLAATSIVFDVSILG
jgi:uncharacterized membrane protein YidH (DUF202 family)